MLRQPGIQLPDGREDVPTVVGLEIHTDDRHDRHSRYQWSSPITPSYSPDDAMEWSTAACSAMPLTRPG
jgi:hypothetical protein